MADTKISALTALAAVDVAPATDVLAVVDTSSTTTKKITVADARMTLATEKASTSGTSIDFTGIPAGVKRITLMGDVVSSSGTTGFLAQIGDAGGLEVSGYISQYGPAGTTSAAGFILYGTSVAARTYTFKVEFVLKNAATFQWMVSGFIVEGTSNAIYYTIGTKSLSAELTQLSVITTNGADTFDAGTINISYE